MKPRLRLQTRPSLSLQDWPPAMPLGASCVRPYRFDTSGARADLDRAAALHPGDAEVLHRSAIVLAMVGDPRAAIAERGMPSRWIRFLRRSVCALHTS